jgi:putative hemolysin
MHRGRTRFPRTEAAQLQELRATAAMARASRLIGAREEKIIVSSLRLSSRPIGEVMLPAEDISMLNVNDDLTTCLISAHLDMHTRFPVTERPHDPQGIAGYVNFKDIVAQMRLAPHAPTLRSILRPIPSFLNSTPIAQCMESMIHSHTHIALVRNEAGDVLGMVTLEDIFEELVGEIYDEHDRLPMHAVVAEAGWVVGGGISLARLRELTGVDLVGDPSDTEVRNLSQWMARQLGRPVTGGDAVEHMGLRVLVRKIRRQQVLEAQVTRIDQRK